MKFRLPQNVGNSCLDEKLLAYHVVGYIIIKPYTETHKERKKETDKKKK